MVRTFYPGGAHLSTKWCALLGFKLIEGGRFVEEGFMASFAPDKRHLWIVGNPHTYTFIDVCSHDALNNVF